MSVLAAAGAVAAAGLNALSTGKTNKKTRKHQEKMYDKQRADNLSDWHMQNEYNSPEAQMKRFKEAGLNPNLIYGQTNTSDAIRSSDTGSYTGQAPNIGNPMSDYLQMEAIKAQTDNVKEQNTLIANQAALAAAQEQEVIAKTFGINFDNSQKDRIKDYTYEAAKLSVSEMSERIAKMNAERASTIDHNKREQDKHQGTLDTMAQNLTNLKSLNDKQVQEINNLKTRNKLDELEYEIRKAGGNPNDPAWQKWLLEAIHATGVKEAIITTIRDVKAGKYKFFKTTGSKKALKKLPPNWK